RDARPAADAVEDVLWLLGRLRGPAQQQCLPGVPRPAWGAPGAERAGAEARGTCGAGTRMHRPSAEPLRAQELLLPRPAERLPDLAVRAAARDRRVAVVPVAGPWDRRHHDPAPARRGGCGEVAARPLPEADGDRSEPLRGAAHRDRRRARFSVAPRGPRVSPHPQTGARV